MNHKSIHEVKVMPTSDDDVIKELYYSMIKKVMIKVVEDYIGYTFSNINDLDAATFDKVGLIIGIDVVYSRDRYDVELDNDGNIVDPQKANPKNYAQYIPDEIKLTKKQQELYNTLLEDFNTYITNILYTNNIVFADVLYVLLYETKVLQYNYHMYDQDNNVDYLNVRYENNGNTYDSYGVDTFTGEFIAVSGINSIYRYYRNKYATIYEFTEKLLDDAYNDNDTSYSVEGIINERIGWEKLEVEFDRFLDEYYFKTKLEEIKKTINILNTDQKRKLYEIIMMYKSVK